MKKLIPLLFLTFFAVPAQAELTTAEIAQVESFITTHLQNAKPDVREKIKNRILKSQKFRLNHDEKLNLTNPNAAFKALCHMSFLLEVDFFRLNLSVIPSEIQNLTLAQKINI